MQVEILRVSFIFFLHLHRCLMVGRHYMSRSRCGFLKKTTPLFAVSSLLELFLHACESTRS